MNARRPGPRLNPQERHERALILRRYRGTMDQNEIAEIRRAISEIERRPFFPHPIGVSR